MDGIFGQKGKAISGSFVQDRINLMGGGNLHGRLFCSGTVHHPVTRSVRYSTMLS